MILFFISVGKEVGIGHLKRCVFLALKLNKLKYDCKFMIPNDRFSIEYLEYYNIKYEIIDKNNKFNFTNNYKLVVLDLLDINKSFTQNFKKNNPEIKLLALDYFDMEDENISVIINLLNHNKKKKPENECVKYLEGIKYGIIRDEFLSYINKSKISTNIFKVLVTFGGSDPQSYTLKLLPYLLDILNQKKYLLEIVIGPNFNNKHLIYDFIKNELNKNHIILHDNPENIAELMFNSDLIISGSGTTPIESATLGRPSILIPQNEKELNFSLIFKKLGIAELGGNSKMILYQNINYYLNKVYNDLSFREKISYLGKKYCKGDGSTLICNEIINLYEN